MSVCTLALPMFFQQDKPPKRCSTQTLQLSVIWGKVVTRAKGAARFCTVGLESKAVCFNLFKCSFFRMKSWFLNMLYLITFASVWSFVINMVSVAHVFNEVENKLTRDHNLQPI